VIAAGSTDEHAGAAGAPLTPRLVAGAALAAGLAAAIFFARAGLTLAHFDAKGHLVVARRIVDSLTPGWIQVGALWLPLPHLINLLPVQIDFFYRTGAFAVAVSVASFGLAAWAIARLVLDTTGSPAGAVLGAAVFAANPNVLYLQATPMTEAQLWGLTCAAVVLARNALATGAPPAIRRAGLMLAAAMLTRYEAWLAGAAVMVLGGIGLWGQGLPWRSGRDRLIRLAAYPAAAVAGFLVLGRLTIGEWFVRSGFFVPEPRTLGQPVAAGVAVWQGLTQLTSEPIAWMALAGAAAAVLTTIVRRERLFDLLPLSLAAMGGLAWFAFYEGHVYRIRYMTALVPMVAVGAGLFVGRFPARARWVAACAVLAALWAGPRPIDRTAPMPMEAQWDHALREGRAEVTAYLGRAWDGTPIMASMGSLAHYMHELSASGFRLRDFLHEGNGDLWSSALAYPDPIVEWILIEESARGGDMLAALVRQRPAFLAGYDRVATGGGVALYRRKPTGNPAAAGTPR